MTLYPAPQYCTTADSLPKALNDDPCFLYSYCVARFPDVLRQAAIVCYEPTWETNLMAMTTYAADTGGCRRAAIQLHFGEAPAMCRCGSVIGRGGLLTSCEAGYLLGNQDSMGLHDAACIQLWRTAQLVCCSLCIPVCACASFAFYAVYSEVGGAQGTITGMIYAWVRVCAVW